MASGFISSKARASISFRVSSVRAMLTQTKSDCDNTSSNAHCSAPTAAASSGRGVRFQHNTRIPNPCARRAIAWPMAPNPTMPRVEPNTSMPAIWVGVQVLHSPSLTYSAASTTRRAEDRMSAQAMSAVVSVRTPGVLPTGIPRAVQAATSTLSTPTAIWETTLSCSPAASRTSASIVSVIRQTRASTPTTRSSSWSRVGGKSTGQTSRSKAGSSTSSANPLPGSTRVTNTRYGAVIGSLPLQAQDNRREND